LQFLKGALLIDQNLLNLHSEALKYDRSCQARPTSRRPKINSLATEVFEGANIGLRQNVQFRNREPHHVVNSIL
jgi:hypothetical protein